MLEAFTTHELLSNIPVQIESICTYEDRLLVGTKQVTFTRITIVTIALKLPSTMVTMVTATIISMVTMFTVTIVTF